MVLYYNTITLDFYVYKGWLFSGMKKFLSVALLSGIFGNLSVGAVAVKGLGRVHPKAESVEEMKEGREGEYVENFLWEVWAKKRYPFSKVCAYMLVFMAVSCLLLWDHHRFRLLEEMVAGEGIESLKRLVELCETVAEQSGRIFLNFKKYIDDNINKSEGFCRPEAINTKCNLDEIDGLRKRFVTHYGGNLANLSRQIGLLCCKVEAKSKLLEQYKDYVFPASLTALGLRDELVDLRKGWSLFVMLHRGQLSGCEKFLRETLRNLRNYHAMLAKLTGALGKESKKMEEFKKQIDEQIEKMKGVSKQINEQIKNMEEFVERIGVQIRGVESSSEQLGFDKQIEKMNIIKGQVEEMDRMKGQVVEQINEMKDCSKQIDEQCTEGRNSQQSAHRDLPQDILQSPVYQFLFNA